MGGVRYPLGTYTRLLGLDTNKKTRLKHKSFINKRELITLAFWLGNKNQNKWKRFQRSMSGPGGSAICKGPEPRSEDGKGKLRDQTEANPQPESRQGNKWPLCIIGQSREIEIAM